MLLLNEDVQKRVAALADFVIIGPDLLPIDSSLDSTTTAALVPPVVTLATLARSACRDLDPSNEMIVLRIGTRRNEIIIARDEEFSIIAVQKRKGVKKQSRNR